MENISDISTSYDQKGESVPQGTLSLPKEGSPPFFSLGTNSILDLSRFTQLQGLSEKEKDLLTAIFDSCMLEEKQLTSMDRVQLRLMESSANGRTISTSAIRKRMKPLTDSGLFQSSSITVPGKEKRRPSTLYTLSDKSQSITFKPAQKTISLSQLELFSGSQSLKEFMNPSLRMDNFWCQLITSVLPIHDRAREIHIESTIYYQGEGIPITATSRPGSRIPTIRSIKTVIALLTLVELIIKENSKSGKNTGQRFVIEIGQLLSLMKLANEGANRRTVLQHLSEWENTLFKFQQIPAPIRESLNERFGVETFGFSDHQLLSQLCGIGILKEGQKTPVKVGFELPHDLVNRIRDQGVYNLFTVTPAIMSENDPLAIAFHLYCRKSIGHRGYHLDISLKNLWKKIAPTLKYKDFMRSFKRMHASKKKSQNDEHYKSVMKEVADETSKVFNQQANILGYTATIIGEHLTVRLDLDDPYVGQASKHKFLKQKEARGVASNHEKTYRLKNPTRYDEPPTKK